MLNNPRFVQKAPEAKVNAERDKLKDYTNKLNICKEQYEDILKKITD